MRITSKGQVTIPLEVRERLGWPPGTRVEFDVEGDEARIRRVGDAAGPGVTLIARMRGTASRKLSTDEIMALTRE